MSFLAKRSSHPLSCNGDSSSEDDVFVNSKLDVYADYYDKPHPQSYFVDLYDPEYTITDHYSKQNKQALSPLFSPRSPGTPRGENDAIIFTIKFCGKQFGEVGLFEPDISVLDWEGFRMYLFSSLNLENPESFVFYYSDDETDKIPIESEAEYKEALKIAKDKSTRQEKFILDINRNTIGFPSLRSLVTSSIRRVNSVGSSVKAIPGPIPEKKDVTTSTSFSSPFGSLESLSIKTYRSELSEESDGLEMTTIRNSQSTPMNFVIDIDSNDCVIKRIIPTSEKIWSRLDIKTYKIGYYEYNRKDLLSLGPRPMQNLGQPATVGKYLDKDVEKPASNNSGRKDEVSFYCTFYCNLDNSEKQVLPAVPAIESPSVIKEQHEQRTPVEEPNTAPSWFKDSMQQLKEDMSQEISSKINERFEDLVGNFNVKDVEERLRGVIKGYGSDVQERVICCCKGKECRRMPSVEELLPSSRVSVDSESLTGQNIWNIDLLKEELERKEKEILSYIDRANDKIKNKFLYNELQRPLSFSNFQSNEDLYVKERERVFNRIEDFRQRQSKVPPSSILRMPGSSKTDSMCKPESNREISPLSPDFTPTRLNFTESDLTEFKSKTLSDNSDMNAMPSRPKSSDFGGRLDTLNYCHESSSPHDAGSNVIMAEEITTFSSPLEYDAKFISDEDFPDGSIVPPGVVFSKTWLVMNTGAKPWDEQTSLFCSNYDSNLLVPCQQTIKCPELKPGEVAKITVNLETPKVCGNSFVTKWKFEHRGAIFGNMLWCKVQVQLSETACSNESPEKIKANISPIDYETVNDITENPVDRKATNSDASFSRSHKTVCETRALLYSMRPPRVEYQTNSDLLDELFNSNIVVNLGQESELVEIIQAEQSKTEGRRDIWQILVDVLKNTYGKEYEESLSKRQDPNVCEDDNEENYEDIENSDHEKEDIEDYSSGDSSGEEYSDEEELSDEEEDENDKDECYLENSTHCEHEKESTEVEPKSSEILRTPKTPIIEEYETKIESTEFKDTLEGKYLTKVFEISNVPERTEPDRIFEEIKEKKVEVEVSVVNKATDDNKAISKIEGIAKELTVKVSEICKDIEDNTTVSDIECTAKEHDERDYEDYSSEDSSCEEYSSDDEELSDEHDEEEEIDENDKESCLGISTLPYGYEEAPGKEQKSSDTLETSTDSLEFKVVKLSKEKYLPVKADISDVPESISADKCFEKVNDENCPMEVPEDYRLTEDLMTPEIESTNKESEIEESLNSDDDISESCKVEESSSASDSHLQLLKANLETAVAPEESLAAELAAAFVEDLSEKAPDSKGSSLSGDESMEKDKSALQDNFKQNVEFNLEFVVSLTSGESISKKVKLSHRKPIKEVSLPYVSSGESMQKEDVSLSSGESMKKDISLSSEDSMKKEISQSSEDSMKKEKSTLQEHFKQNVEVNLDFEVISHSNSSEVSIESTVPENLEATELKKSPSPETRELPSGQGCPLTFKERHFTISHLPPPNPTTVPDSDDDDSYDGLVFIRPEDVPSSAPETAPGTPSASEDPLANREFPPPSESERSVSCSSLSDYKNADDEDSDSDSESCSSFSGVEEEDVAEAAATGDDGFDDISRMKDLVECSDSDYEFCLDSDNGFFCYQWKE